MSLVSGHMSMYLLFIVVWWYTCVVSGKRLLYLCGNTLLHLCSVCLKVSVSLSLC